MTTAQDIVRYELELPDIQYYTPSLYTTCILHTCLSVQVALVLYAV